MAYEGARKSPAEMAIEYSNWLSRRVYQSDVGKGTDYFKHNSVDRRNNLVQLTKDSIEYVIGFTGERGPERADGLFVLVSGYDNPTGIKDILTGRINKLLVEVQERTEDFTGKIEDLKARDYKKIIDNKSLTVLAGEIQFGGANYVGTKVAARIKKIPTGKEGGLSDKLFRLINVEIITPIHELAKK